MEYLTPKLPPNIDTTLALSPEGQHLAFSSLPTDVRLMAQELFKVKSQLKARAQLVGCELTRIDHQVQLLDLQSEKMKESFATQVAGRLGNTHERQATDEAVTSQLHDAVQRTDEQSMNRDLLLDQEIVRINEQNKRAWENQERSLNLIREELQQHQESR